MGYNPLTAQEIASGSRAFPDEEGTESQAHINMGNVKLNGGNEWSPLQAARRAQNVTITGPKNIRSSHYARALHDSGLRSPDGSVTYLGSRERDEIILDNASVPAPVPAVGTRFASICSR